MKISGIIYDLDDTLISRDEAFYSGFTNKFYTHTTPHNQYLYVWFEIGFFGLVLLLSFFYLQIKQLIKFEDKFHTILLPIIFLLLMCVDSYLTIFTGAITYMFLFTIYTRYNNLAG